MSVRAKFKVQSVTITENSRQVRMTPVYPDKDNPENKEFWDATPNGELAMTITNPAGFGLFQPGQSYYLDFTHAP